MANAERRGGFAGRPDVDESLEAVFLLLQAEIVARRAGIDAGGTAETVALVADDRLDGGEQFGGGHHADGHARAAEDRLDDLAVAVVGDDARRPSPCSRR